jgi:hypothetical protein
MKLDAIAAVVTKLVDQRKAMHEQMQKMMSANEKEGIGMWRMMMGIDIWAAQCMVICRIIRPKVRV